MWGRKVERQQELCRFCHGRARGEADCLCICSVLMTQYEADFETRILKHRHDRGCDASERDGTVSSLVSRLSVLSHHTFVHIASRQMICLEQNTRQYQGSRHALATSKCRSARRCLRRALGNAHPRRAYSPPRSHTHKPQPSGLPQRHAIKLLPILPPRPKTPQTSSPKHRTSIDDHSPPCPQNSPSS